MFLRDTIRRRRHRIAGDLAIMVIGVLTAAAPASAALADAPSAADETLDPTGADGPHRPVAELDAVELRRIPDTARRLATYWVTTDDAEPLRRSNRDGLVAVVSDAPEALRAKRRDVEANDHAIELTSRLAHVDSGWEVHVEVVEL